MDFKIPKIGQGKSETADEFLETFVASVVDADLSALVKSEGFETWFLSELREELGLPRIVGRIPLKILQYVAKGADNALKKSAEQALGYFSATLLGKPIVKKSLQKSLEWLKAKKQKGLPKYTPSAAPSKSEEFTDLKDWAEKQGDQLKDICSILNQISQNQEAFNTLLSFKTFESSTEAYSHESLDWLVPNSERIPFKGRDEELAKLDSFANCTDSCKIWIATGPSGSGKTRLALEWMRRNETFWHAGFVDQEQSGWDQWVPFDDTFIVVDYAHISRGLVAKIVKRLNQLTDKSKWLFRVRLLILDHRFDFKELVDGTGHWKQEMGSGSTLGIFQNLLFKLESDLEPQPLELSGDTEARQEMLREIVKDAAGEDANNHALQEGMDWMDANENAGYPLFAALVGYSIRRKESIEGTTRRKLITKALEYSKRLVWLTDRVAQTGQAAGAFVCLSTVHGHASQAAREATLSDTEKQNVKFIRDAKKLAEYIVSSEPDTGDLPSFQPDIVGETFVLEFFNGDESATQVKKDLLLQAVFSEEGVRHLPSLREFFRRTTLNLCNDFAPENAAYKDTTHEKFWLSLLPDFQVKSELGEALKLIALLTVSNTLFSRDFHKQAEALIEGLDADTLLKTLETLLAAIRLENEESADELAAQLLNETVKADNIKLFDILIDALNSLELIKLDINAFALVSASFDGNIEILERLIATGANADQGRAGDGATALIAASYAGHVEVVERLIAAKAKVNQATTDDVGWTALMVASQGGHVEVVEFLIAAGADVNQGAADNGATALMAASVGGGHAEVVEKLIAAEADVNQGRTDNGATALMAASAGGHVEVVKRLIAAEADVNQATTDNGVTALMIATAHGHEEVVGRLIATEVDVNQGTTDDGFTALIAASAGGHVEVVERLIAAKADVNQGTTDGGWTALMLASTCGHKEVVERLIAGEAKVNQGMRDTGFTALMFANARGHKEVQKLLIAAGAKE